MKLQHINRLITRAIRIHKMWIIATDYLGQLPVCKSHGQARKTPEWMKVLLRVETLGDPRNTVLDRSPNFPHAFNAAFAKLLWPLVSSGSSSWRFTTFRACSSLSAASEGTLSQFEQFVLMKLSCRRPLHLS